MTLKRIKAHTGVLVGLACVVGCLFIVTAPALGRDHKPDCLHPSAKLLVLNVVNGAEMWVRVDELNPQIHRLMTWAENMPTARPPVARRILEIHTSELRDSDRLVRLGMSTGRTLVLTAPHPILLTSGEIIRADKISVGNMLVGIDGAAVEVTSVARERFGDRVYNVVAEDVHLIAAEGVIVGDLSIQHELGH